VATPNHEKSSNRNMTSFHLGDWRVDVNTGRIQRNNEEIRLEPQVMAVLTVLANRAGIVVGREELEEEAWAGKVVGYDALASTIIKLRKALGDDARNPHYIETVSKKGYRLIAEVSTGQSEVSGISTTAPGKNGTSSASDRQQKQYIYLALALIVIITVTWLLATNLSVTTVKPVSTEQPVKRTILVLPFSSIDGNSNEEYFIDGITDDIITELSGLSGVEVLSSTATYRFKGQQTDLKKISEETGADFFLQGSVRKSGNQWRINAKLINAYNNTNLWAGRFENTQTNIFAAQDEITKGIVESLAVQLSAQDRAHLNKKTTINFEAYDLFLQGQKLFKERTREANETAQEDYRKAIELDANFSRAYSALAVSLVVHFWRGWTDTPNETLDSALKMAKTATELDPTSPQAFWALGYAYMYLRQSDNAAAAVEKILKLVPNYSDAFGMLALINNQRGDGKKAVQLITKGMKLNPYYSWDFPYILGRGYYTMRKYNDAIEPLSDALNRNEQAINPRLFLAATYVALGQIDDAKWQIEQIRIMSPETTVSQIEKNYPISDKQLLQRFLQHLREAGLPNN